MVTFHADNAAERFQEEEAMSPEPFGIDDSSRDGPKGSGQVGGKCWTGCRRCGSNRWRSSRARPCINGLVLRRHTRKKSCCRDKPGMDDVPVALTAWPIGVDVSVEMALKLAVVR